MSIMPIMPFDEWIINKNLTIDTRNSSCPPDDYHKIRGVKEAEEYCKKKLNLDGQLQYIDRILKNPENDYERKAAMCLKCWVNSDCPSGSPDGWIELFGDLTPTKDTIIEGLDYIIEHIPPINKTITTYRVYKNMEDTENPIMMKSPESIFSSSRNEGAPLNKTMKSGRYVSTSLSYTYVFYDFGAGRSPDQYTWRRSRNPFKSIYVRFDILPGTRIIPLLNFEEIARGVETGAYCETQFEIVLPRIANMYGVPIIPDFQGNPCKMIVSPVQRPQYRDMLCSGLKPNDDDKLPIYEYHFIVTPPQEYLDKFFFIYSTVNIWIDTEQYQQFTRTIFGIGKGVKRKRGGGFVDKKHTNPGDYSNYISFKKVGKYGIITLSIPYDKIQTVNKDLSLSDKISESIRLLEYKKTSERTRTRRKYKVGRDSSDFYSYHSSRSPISVGSKKFKKKKKRKTKKKKRKKSKKTRKIKRYN